MDNGLTKYYIIKTEEDGFEMTMVRHTIWNTFKSCNVISIYAFTSYQSAEKRMFEIIEHKIKLYGYNDKQVMPRQPLPLFRISTTKI